MADQKDIKKSVEETVNQILSAGEQPANGGATQAIADPTSAVVTKAMPESSPANGGEDKIKSGSPMSEEQKAEEAKKAQAAKDEKEKKEKEEDEAKKAMADKESKEKESKEKEAKEKEACKSKMKKSIDELAQHLDEDELELIKAWREESEKEVVAKSQEAAPAPQATAPSMEQITEVLKKAVAESTADLKKAIDEKDTLIKGLNDKIEKMASQPAYDRRSISNLETLEKSGSAPAEMTKSQVLDKMLELQAAGKGVTSHHIAEFEATRNISDPTVRGIVFRELKLN